MDVPVMETKRLRLRGHRVSDFADVAGLWGDPAVTRFIGGVPQSTEAAWSRLLRYAGHWTLLGFGYWVIEERVSGTFVGEVGFADYKRMVEPPLNGPEMGWVIRADKHGLGFATEAVGGALDWGRRHWGARAVSCLIHLEHGASLRVARKAGFEERGVGKYNGQATRILERTL